MPVERFLTRGQAVRALAPVASGIDPRELLAEAVSVGLIESVGRPNTPLYQRGDVLEVRDRLKALAEARLAEDKQPPTTY